MNYKVVEGITEERGSRRTDNIEMPVREIRCERQLRWQKSKYAPATSHSTDRNEAMVRTVNLWVTCSVMPGTTELAVRNT